MSLKPNTRREWIKLCWDILILVIFIYMVYTVSSAYADGFTAGYSSCMTNLSVKSLGILGNITVP
jgi:hypothetical protein